MKPVMCKFEWLLRTDMRCGVDNLIVERAQVPRRIALETGNRKCWKQNRVRQEEGIARAKKGGKYKGRKKISVDINLLRQIADDFEKKRITEAEAMNRAGIASQSTFYRRLKGTEEFLIIQSRYSRTQRSSIVK